MSPDEMMSEIRRLRAELAEEREERKRMGRALEDAMAAVRAAADDRKAIESRRAADRERRRRADRARAERSIEQAASRDVGASSSRESHVSGFPPLLEGSPPPSDPSSPSPISSPPSLSSPSAAPRNELRLVAQEAPRHARKPKSEKPTDPRHRPLLEQLVAQGWELGGSRGARAVSDLLARAGEAVGYSEAPGEVLRRAGHALQKRRTAPNLFPAVAELWELVSNWKHFDVPFQASQGRGPAPPSDFSSPTPYTPPAWLDPDFGKE